MKSSLLLNAHRQSLLRDHHRGIVVRVSSVDHKETDYTSHNTTTKTY